MSTPLVDDFGKEIFEAKYKGDAPDAFTFFRDLAKRVSKGDRNKQHRFFKLMWDRRFAPGGRILAYAGRPSARLSRMNCTAHAILDDSLEGINQAAYTIMRASSRGQGIGIDLSRLRPAGAPVNNAARTSTGAISFMEMLNGIGATIGQEGRRAALLFSLSVDHPDVYRPGDRSVQCPKCQGRGCGYCLDGHLPYDFLHVKKIPGKVESANISVRVSDAFMRRVERGLPWTMSYSGMSGGSPFQYEHAVPARELFDALAQAAYSSAEPGLLYWDTSKRMSNSDLFGKRWEIVATNSCSEEVLAQDDVCLLGSLNLSAYVRDPFTRDAAFDFASFRDDVPLAVEFLDNVIDLELEHQTHTGERQRDALIHLRRVGLGVMGLADMLAMLGLRYGGEAETAQFLEQVFTALRDTAYRATVRLAQERGPALVWEQDGDYRSHIVQQGFFATLPEDIQESIRQNGTRNITVLSIAPTGTISNLLGVSSGIEPVFALSYVRRHRMSGEDKFIDYVHPGVRLSRAMGVSDDIWPTAYEVTPEEHVLVQALAQKYIDASIAKTLNFPGNSTAQDVGDMYMAGWRAGLKGMAVYVDGSRSEQVLYQKESEQAAESCPECGAELVNESGCKSCHACGYALCSL